MYSFPLSSRTFLDRATSLPESVQMDLNAFSNHLYDKKLLVDVSRAIYASISSQTVVNSFSAIMQLAIGTTAASAERTPLWTVCRTDSNHFMSSLSLTSESIYLIMVSGTPLMPVNLSANFAMSLAGLKESKCPRMVLCISVVILSVLRLVTLHFLVAFVQVLAYFPLWGVSDSGGSGV